jgi:hypothetical protein
VDVNYTTSGTSGNWVLNFSVTNNIGINLDLYYWGVVLPGDTITGMPTNWTIYSYGLNGANLAWMAVEWYNFNYQAAIHNGETKDGFPVSDTSVTAPTSVIWAAYLYDFNGSGSTTYNGDPNPIFWGTAYSNTVPIPATIWLLGSGLIGLIGVRRRFTG